MIVNLDFETRNKVDIKAGASKYAETAEILCLAYSIDRGEIRTWRPTEPYPMDLLSAIENGAEVRAWNASFERAIWAKVMERHYDWPKVQKWRCTMAAALACGLPGSLENAAKALKLDVEKDMAGRRLMLKMAKPCEVKIPLDPSKYKVLLIGNNPKRAKHLQQFTFSEEYIPGFDIVVFEYQSFENYQNVVDQIAGSGALVITTNAGNFEPIPPYMATDKKSVPKALITKAMESLRRFRNEPTKRMGWHENEEDFEKLLAYCAQDVKTEMAVDAIVPPLWKTEEGVYEFDHTVNSRGVKFDRPLVESCIKVWDKYVQSLDDELSRITFSDMKSSEVAKIISMLQSLGAPVGSLEKASVSNALSTDGILPTARRILEIRQLAAKSSVKKFNRILQCIESDDRIRGCTQYHGASTGRFAGRLIQLQNLFRGILKMPKGKETEFLEAVAQAIMSQDIGRIAEYGEVGDVLASMIRPSIVPDDGKRLIAFDFSSVESRGTAWVSGEEWLLEAFRNKECAYTHMASKVYSKPYESIAKDSEERFYGKQLVLGCGYQLGGAGFQKYLDGYGVSLDLERCNQLVKIFRESNKQIVKLWYALERAAVDCVQSGRPQKCRNITYHISGRWLCCRLPSGRDIRYLDPQLAPGTFDKPQIRFTGSDISGKPIRESTYGGKLTENCIAEDTKVLTDRGWVAIQDIRIDDLVHDGVTFVSHGGLVNKSVQKCVEVDGVRMTPDHEVLTDDGWKIALENPRPYRPKIRNADLYRNVAYNKAKFSAQVYDILNCGPRHRFVVLGTNGPFVVHNCIQAICRDMLVWAMARLEKAGYPVVFHVHDEAVVEVPDDFGSVEEVKKIMTEIPDWATGFPIDAEGFETKRYRK